MKISEIIVVEGRDDITALKRVVDGHIIALNGFSGITKKSVTRLFQLSKYNDIILLTDPDHAGKKIRNVLKEKIPNIKHVFIERKNAIKGNNVGVENASDEVIIEALSNVIKYREKIGNNQKYIFTIRDLMVNGLCFGTDSRRNRIKLGDILKIGYYNSKQLLAALNSFNISKEKFQKAVRKIKSD
ncbi:ribonuclease M5 [Leptotrichia sp. OH3620_COT-345]|nr:ribonuclease M5 [Leptotrichia sp. OH3620_COT-345]